MDEWLLVQGLNGPVQQGPVQLPQQPGELGSGVLAGCSRAGALVLHCLSNGVGLAFSGGAHGAQIPQRNASPGHLQGQADSAQSLRREAPTGVGADQADSDQFFHLGASGPGVGDQ